jgi:hypothetical protein
VSKIAKGAVMPIRPLLAGQAFDPEAITKMSTAFESICVALSLKLVDEAAMQLVAQKIIDLAQRGVKDVDGLNAMTLEHFEHQQHRLSSVSL